MKIYHGERTGEGCRVMVDGVPLRVRSDLSGAAAPFDWGYVGNGQLSLALLSDLLGDGQKAKALSEAFERRVVAELPRDAWTVTEDEFAAALEALARADASLRGAGATSAGAGSSGAGASGAASADLGGVGFGDMPVQTGNLVSLSGENDRAPNYVDSSAGGEGGAPSESIDTPMSNGRDQVAGRGQDDPAE